jgi:hypothetical protein
MAAAAVVPAAQGVRAGTPAPSAAFSLRGPLDLPLLARERRASLTAPGLEAGDLEALFDGNRRTAAGPAGGSGGLSVQVALDRQRPVEAFEVALPGAGGRWSVAAAASEADMQGRRGSYRVLVSPRAARGNDQAVFVRPAAYRVYRLECQPAPGAKTVELAEWELWSEQSLRRVDLDAFSPTLARGSKLQLGAWGRFEAGARQNLTQEVTWEVSPPGAGTVDELQRFEGLRAGRAEVRARFRGLRSAPLVLEVLPQGHPDWDVTHIELQPRRDYSASAAELKPGQKLYWFAHVKNYGTGDAEPVAFEWRVDGKTVRTGRLPKVARFCQTEVILGTEWDGRPHSIELVVDPANDAAETSEGNNSLRVASDAEPVGFWVEESTLRYFHRHQRELGVGSNSWEDWAQRQVAAMNDQSAAAGGGEPRRWRLDRVVVVGDGMLPLAPGAAASQPDSRDTSVRVQPGAISTGGPPRRRRPTRSSCTRPW